MLFTKTLKKTYQFKRVYRKEKSYANRFLILYVIPNQTDQNGLGVSVSKKVGKSVVRSRVTRLIKESYRLSEEKIKNGFDLVFVARSNAAGATYYEIRNALMHLLKKQNLLRPESPEDNEKKAVRGGDIFEGSSMQITSDV